jgi:hypothetical protein
MEVEDGGASAAVEDLNGKLADLRWAPSKCSSVVGTHLAACLYNATMDEQRYLLSVLTSHSTCSMTHRFTDASVADLRVGGAVHAAFTELVNQVRATACCSCLSASCRRAPVLPQLDAGHLDR